MKYVNLIGETTYMFEEEECQNRFNNRGETKSLFSRVNKDVRELLRTCNWKTNRESSMRAIMTI